MFDSPEFLYCHKEWLNILQPPFHVCSDCISMIARSISVGMWVSVCAQLNQWNIAYAIKFMALNYVQPARMFHVLLS